jgi:hypothetical protein
MRSTDQRPRDHFPKIVLNHEPERADCAGDDRADHRFERQALRLPRYEPESFDGNR